MKVHEKIRFMRQSKNWSQEDMATKLGMSVNGYAKIEHGKTDATYSKLEQIAGALDADLMDLMTFGEKHICMISGDNQSNTGCNIIGSTELAFEIQKLQLQLELKDKEISLQQREIENLKEIITLLKTKTTVS